METYAQGSKVTGGSTAGANAAARNARPAGGMYPGGYAQAQQFARRRGDQATRRNR